MSSSPCGSVFTPARRHGFVLFGILGLLLSLWACGSSRLTTDRTYQELKPKEQLPERELRNLPKNLIVRIENVADNRQNYKNYVVLRINGREIAPLENISNFSSTYSYPMRLQHGVYEIKAEYHSVGYWREQVFEIVPDEPIKIMPNQRTILEARLAKNHRGELLDDPAMFRVSIENIVTEPPPSAQIETPAAISIAPPLGTSSSIIAEPIGDIDQHQDEIPPIKSPSVQKPLSAPPPPAIEPEAEPANRSALVTLQINTSPAGAEVIVDDRYYGQSPIKVAVDKNRDHVIQVSRPGHRDAIKILSATELQSVELLQLVIKLEAVEAERSND